MSRVPNIGTRYNKMGIIMSTSIILLDKNFNTNDTDKKFGGNRCHGPNFYNGGAGMCKCANEKVIIKNLLKMGKNLKTNNVLF